LTGPEREVTGFWRKPLRVLLNLLVASGRKTGIGHYVSQLLRCLQELSPDDHFEEFPRPWLRWCWSRCNQLRPYLERKRRPGDRPSPGQGASCWHKHLMGNLRRAGQQVIGGHLRRVSRRRRFDLYHEPNYIPLPSDLPTVATVHDLSILLHPEWHPADRVAHFEQGFDRALRQCVHFLAISEAGRQEIIRTFNLPPECVTRTYMGVRPGLSELPTQQVRPVLRRLRLPEQYLLYLGTIEPRKNLLTLLKAYCGLPAELRRDWPLLLVGGWGWNTESVRDYLHHEGRHRGVIHLGYVPDEFLNILYNGARALVYPSFYEGFGLPPMEMLACGGAVLASTAAALVETVGSQAHLISPDDTDSWRQAMQLILEDDDWWRSLRRGAADIARPFTWERCAADTFRVYRAVAGELQVTSPAVPVRRAA
jgi:alpha-1,3-rhamnosyl/mannosyltransferase